ncbi:MAG: rhamnogalacturonan acetylesterase [Treponema sp.]|nr:rhamnogalacturonan acetylesterase [Treponema sp.]
MRIICIGDSIMQYNDCSTYPQTGWVQELGRFFSKDTTIINYARNGRSTKSFINEGRFAVVKSQIVLGDIVLIGFGHNDEKEMDPSRYTDPCPDGKFRANLTVFVTELQALQALPILLTPVARRKFTQEHVMEDTHGIYPEAICAVAKQEHIPCIDLTALTTAFFEKVGEHASRNYFMNFDAGIYENFPDGKSDNSHLRPDGAFIVSQLVAQQLQVIAKEFPLYATLQKELVLGGIDWQEFDRDTADESLMA